MCEVEADDEPTAWASPTEQGLYGVLRTKGLLSAEVLHQLGCGRRYWQLERQLCAAMAQAGRVDLASVYRASALKSFDYRVLHALLCQASGRAASVKLLNFLEVDEVLTDMADDLFDYEKDVRKNSFNVLRGAAHALGHRAPLALAAKIGELEAVHEARLAALPVHQADAYRASRRAAMARPGSEKWVFPRLMLPHEESRWRSAAEAEWADASRGGGGEPSEVESDAEEPPAKRLREKAHGCEEAACAPQESARQE